MGMSQQQASSGVEEVEARRRGRGAHGAALRRRTLQPRTRLGLWMAGRGTAQRWSCESAAIGEGGATKLRPSPRSLAGREAFAAQVGRPPLELDMLPSPSPLLALCAAVPRRALPRQPLPPLPP